MGGSQSDGLGCMKMASPQSDLQALFVDIVSANETIRVLTERLAELGLPDSYVAAGCLCQTVWNHICGFPRSHGIIDYDIFYCDLSDLSWEGEDQVIRRCAVAFADLAIDVQVRNQARVHLWYPEKFGVPQEPLRSTPEGIDGFLTRCSAHGLRKTPSGGYEVYAPFGFDDVFAMVVRPNHVHNLPSQYKEKADRWRQTWPRITVTPWENVGLPGDGGVV